jgi:hypothetical protein
MVALKPLKSKALGMKEGEGLVAWKLAICFSNGEGKMTLTNFLPNCEDTKSDRGSH